MRKALDGSIYYGLDEVEGKVFEKIDLFIFDVVLIFFSLHGPLTFEEYQAGLFGFYQALKKMGYTFEDPHFLPAQFPYSFLLHQELCNLLWSGFVEENGELFTLTERGKREARAIIEEKLREEDLQYFMSLTDHG